jgi:hypothetical protein
MDLAYWGIVERLIRNGAAVELPLIWIILPVGPYFRFGGALLRQLKPLTHHGVGWSGNELWFADSLCESWRCEHLVVFGCLSSWHSRFWFGVGVGALSRLTTRSPGVAV